MNSRFTHIRAIPLMLLALNACAVSAETEAPDDDVAMAEQRLLAEAEIPGGSAKFLAVDSDMLLIVTDTTGVPNPVMDTSIRGLTAAEIYEDWTRETAPAELLEWAFPMSSIEAGSPAEPAEYDAAERVGVTTSALTTSAQFAADFCTNNVDYCLLDWTGTWEHEQRARGWTGSVSAVVNDISIQMRRRDVLGGWANVWVVPDIPQGQTLGFLTATSEAALPRPLKFKVFDAEGDRYHAAAHWY